MLAEQHGGIASNTAFAKMCFRLDCMNKMLDWTELPTMWIIIVALIMAFSETWLYLSHTSAQAGCLFREHRCNSHCSDVCFSILLADTIPANDSSRATGTTSADVTGEGFIHGRKWGYGLASFPNFWEASTQSPCLVWGHRRILPSFRALACI